MPRQIRPISFDSFAATAGHLDRWAANALTKPGAVVGRARRFGRRARFRLRNPALFLAYEIDGPAAGAKTSAAVNSRC